MSRGSLGTWGSCLARNERWRIHRPEYVEEKKHLPRDLTVDGDIAFGRC